MKKQYIGVKKPKGLDRSTNLNLIFIKFGSNYICKQRPWVILTEAEVKYDISKGYLKEYNERSKNDT